MITVLIVDADLGFVFWLGRVLAEAGYDPLPAKSIHDAAQLLGYRSGPPPDLLVMSTHATRSRSFVAHLRTMNPELRVISLAAHADSEFLTAGDAASAKWRNEDA